MSECVRIFVRKDSWPQEDLWIQEVKEKQEMNKISRHEIDLDERNLKSYRIRRMDPKILKFSKNPYPGGNVEDKHLRMLGTILKSSKRVQKMDLNLME